MTTISVPLDGGLMGYLDDLVSRTGASRAAVMRKALERFNEELIINDILARTKEPSLSGDLRELLKQID